MSPSLMSKVAYFGITLRSYEEAEHIIKNELNITIDSDTIRKVVNYVGQSVYLYESKKAYECMEQFHNGSLNFTNNKNGILFLEIDGAHLNTRLKNKKESSWRENKLCIAFNSNDCTEYTNSDGEKCLKIGKREYISIFGSVDEFKKHCFYLALKRGHGEFKETVLINDGANWIRALKDELFPSAQQILDFFHLAQNTNKFAHAIFKDDKTKAHDYYLYWRDLLKNGEYEEVLRDIFIYKDYKFNDGTVNLYNYITNNINNIDYPTYKKRGYFIGSGAIESANKYVIQSRLKGPGMKWNPVTAQYVISLRAKYCSNSWPEVDEILINRLQNN